MLPLSRLIGCTNIACNMIVHQIKVAEEHVPHHKTSNLITSQQGFQEYIKNRAFGVGSFVVYKTMFKVTHVWQIFSCVDEVDDFNLLEFNHVGQPRDVALAVYNPHYNPPVRLDTSMDYRLITPEEYQQWIEPARDNIQNYLQQKRLEYLGQKKPNPV